MALAKLLIKYCLIVGVTTVSLIGVCWEQEYMKQRIERIDWQNTHMGAHAVWMPISLRTEPEGSLFAQYFGGSGAEFFYSIVKTSDSGYVAVGDTSSFGAGGFDALLVKLDASGAIVWEKAYGGAFNDSAYSVIQTTDSGYLIAGDTSSFGAGCSDMLIVKVDASGNIDWKRTIGGDKCEYAHSAKQVSDGGYIIAGGTSSINANSYDALVLKLNSYGNILWRRTFDIENEMAWDIIQTLDGSYVVIGESGNGLYQDVLAIRLNSSGNVLWKRKIGSNYNEGAYSIVQTSDEGCIIAGCSNSFSSENYNDVLVMKLNTSGNLLWRRNIGTDKDECGLSAAQTPNGNSIISGYTNSLAPFDNTFMLEMNTNGNIMWKRTLNGTYAEWASSVIPTADGNFIIAGWSESFGTAYVDALVVKVNAYGIIPGCNLFSTPSFTVSAPVLSISAPVMIVKAPALSISAPSLIITTANLTSGNACP
ncbi:MAG: hypothetical protein A2Y62_13780 [Candidatus Fischerbacteria bacterium RBG_13_37_8]|uniref:Pyrrolo-quinoline quinone repeat domain-containing protein n=1 Tax=Candidatus Fischerbacteria bacterium RBG_13_37_8 TaxID=1817863 RepID=A0A1F5VYE0_9BACT|nr:MAG: hypothetical protein A2Y62_13780 [Candidatus Fischerbacteria bacterium RBG_13_37_8]